MYSIRCHRLISGLWSCRFLFTWLENQGWCLEANCLEMPIQIRETCLINSNKNIFKEDIWLHFNCGICFICIAFCYTGPHYLGNYSLCSYNANRLIVLLLQLFKTNTGHQYKITAKNGPFKLNWSQYMSKKFADDILTLFENIYDMKIVAST